MTAIQTPKITIGYLSPGKSSNSITSKWKFWQKVGNMGDVANPAHGYFSTQEEIVLAPGAKAYQTKELAQRAYRSKLLKIKSATSGAVAIENLKPIETEVSAFHQADPYFKGVDRLKARFKAAGKSLSTNLFNDMSRVTQVRQTIEERRVRESVNDPLERCSDHAHHQHKDRVNKKFGWFTRNIFLRRAENKAIEADDTVKAACEIIQDDLVKLRKCFGLERKIENFFDKEDLGYRKAVKLVDLWELKRIAQEDFGLDIRKIKINTSDFSKTSAQQFYEKMLELIPLGKDLDGIIQNAEQERLDQTRYAEKNIIEFDLQGTEVVGRLDSQAAPVAMKAKCKKLPVVHTADGKTTRPERMIISQCINKNQEHLLTITYNEKTKEVDYDLQLIAFDDQGKETSKESVTITSRLVGSGIPEELYQYFSKSILDKLNQSKTHDFNQLFGNLRAEAYLQRKAIQYVHQDIAYEVENVLTTQDIQTIRGTGYDPNAAFVGENFHHGVRRSVMGVLTEKFLEGRVAGDGYCGFQQNIGMIMGASMCAYLDFEHKAYRANPHGNDPYTVEEKRTYSEILDYTASAGVYEKPIGKIEIKEKKLFEAESELSPTGHQQLKLNDQGNPVFKEKDQINFWKKRELVPLAITVVDAQGDERSHLVRGPDQQPVMIPEGMKLVAVKRGDQEKKVEFLTAEELIKGDITQFIFERHVEKLEHQAEVLKQRDADGNVTLLAAKKDEVVDGKTVKDEKGDAVTVTHRFVFSPDKNDVGFHQESTYPGSTAQTKYFTRLPHFKLEAEGSFRYQAVPIQIRCDKDELLDMREDDDVAKPPVTNLGDWEKANKTIVVQANCCVALLKAEDKNQRVDQPFVDEIINHLRTDANQLSGRETPAVLKVQAVLRQALAKAQNKAQSTAAITVDNLLYEFLQLYRARALFERDFSDLTADLVVGYVKQDLTEWWDLAEKKVVPINCVHSQQLDSRSKAADPRMQFTGRSHKPGMQAEYFAQGDAMLLHSNAGGTRHQYIQQEKLNREGAVLEHAELSRGQGAVVTSAQGHGDLYRFEMGHVLDEDGLIQYTTDDKGEISFIHREATPYTQDIHTQATHKRFEGNRPDDYWVFKSGEIRRDQRALEKELELELKKKEILANSKKYKKAVINFDRINDSIKEIGGFIYYSHEPSAHTIKNDLFRLSSDADISASESNGSNTPVNASADIPSFSGSQTSVATVIPQTQVSQPPDSGVSASERGSSSPSSLRRSSSQETVRHVPRRPETPDIVASASNEPAEVEVISPEVGDLFVAKDYLEKAKGFLATQTSSLDSATKEVLKTLISLHGGKLDPRSNDDVMMALLADALDKNKRFTALISHLNQLKHQPDLSRLEESLNKLIAEAAAYAQQKNKVEQVQNRVLLELKFRPDNNDSIRMGLGPKAGVGVPAVVNQTLITAQVVMDPSSHQAASHGLNAASAASLGASLATAGLILMGIGAEAAITAADQIRRLNTLKKDLQPLLENISKLMALENLNKQQKTHLAQLSARLDNQLKAIKRATSDQIANATINGTGYFSAGVFETLSGLHFAAGVMSTAAAAVTGLAAPVVITALSFANVIRQTHLLNRVAGITKTSEFKHFEGNRGVDSNYRIALRDWLKNKASFHRWFRASWVSLGVSGAAATTITGLAVAGVALAPVTLGVSVIPVALAAIWVFGSLWWGRKFGVNAERGTQNIDRDFLLNANLGETYGRLNRQSIERTKLAEVHSNTQQKVFRSVSRAENLAYRFRWLGLQWFMPTATGGGYRGILQRAAKKNNLAVREQLHAGMQQYENNIWSHLANHEIPGRKADLADAIKLVEQAKLDAGTEASTEAQKNILTAATQYANKVEADLKAAEARLATAQSLVGKLNHTMPLRELRDLSVEQQEQWDDVRLQFMLAHGLEDAYSRAEFRENAANPALKKTFKITDGGRDWLRPWRRTIKTASIPPGNFTLPTEEIDKRFAAFWSDSLPQRHAAEYSMLMNIGLDTIQSERKKTRQMHVETVVSSKASRTRTVVDRQQTGEEPGDKSRGLKRLRVSETSV